MRFLLNARVKYPILWPRNNYAALQKSMSEQRHLFKSVEIDQSNQRPFLQVNQM
ncbi:hypothetical protein NTGHW29_150038 [Candidatus Nitrotoga sp. HW29]|nr:hypothetical protein NTGHW29_150038 [Candidatus Nitrotoga sp. HW29]